MTANDYKKQLVDFLKNDGYNVTEDNDTIIVIHNYQGKDKGVAMFFDVKDVNTDLGDVVELETSMIIGFSLRRTDKELICLRDRIAQAFGVSLIRMEKEMYILKIRNICAEQTTLNAAAAWGINCIFGSLKMIGVTIVRK